MYFEISSILNRNVFDTKLLTYQYLYDIRTWPLGLDIKFPIRLEKKNGDEIFFADSDETVDMEKGVLINYGKVTGKYFHVGNDKNGKGLAKQTNIDVDNDNDKNLVIYYFIFEATLYQGCVINTNYDTSTIYAMGKIFFTLELDIFKHCYCDIEWDSFFQEKINNQRKKKNINLCSLLLNNEINYNYGFCEKMNLIMAKKEYKRKCMMRECCAKERIIITRNLY